jgi:hypothetical protein
MAVNRDQENAHKVRIEFDGPSSVDKSFFSGPLNLVTFGSAQYQWHPTATGGFPDPDGPASKSTLTANAETIYELPAASMTVIRGAIASSSAKSKVQ